MPPVPHTLSHATALNTSDPFEPDLPLLQIIELKWLLTGMGVHIHVERLQHDPVYAREQLGRAAESPNPTLRKAASRLLARLLPEH